MNLPENVVLEILLRLPTCSVLRFKCVCKGWCAVIKSSLFKDKHLSLKQGTDVVVFKRLLRSDDGKLIYWSYVTCYDYECLLNSVSSAESSSNEFEVTSNFPPDYYPFIVNQVNGILCIVGGDEGNYCRVTLLNPTIREIRTLPVPDLGFKWYTQCFGLGFDDSTNEYKVAGIVTLIEEGCYNKHIGIVYRLSTNSWIILGEIPPFLFVDDTDYICKMRQNLPSFIGSHHLCWHFSPRTCTFANGSVHWLKLSESSQILTFDMTTELFDEIKFPRAWEEDYGYEIAPILFAVEPTILAFVAFTSSSRCNGHTLLDVWVMNEYGISESWTKQYSVTPFPEQISSVLCFWRKDKIFIETGEGDITCYDFSKGQLYQPYIIHYGEVLEPLTCVESFVSVKEI